MGLKYKITISSVFILIILLFPFVSANAKEATIGNFKFIYENCTAKDIWVTQIDIMGKNNISTLSIPAQINGKNVVKLGGEGDEDAVSFNIFGMYRSEDDEKIAPVKTAKKVARIKKIVLPDTVEEITPNCFSYVQKGKSINIPGRLTKNVLFLRGTKWKKFSVSPQNPKYKAKDNFILSKNGKRIYGYVGMDKKVILPKGTRIIEERAFYGADISNISLPKTIKKIKSEAFSYIKSVHIHISKKNENYAVKNDCVYSKKSGRLVVAAVKSGVITVPDKVTCLKEGTSFAGNTVKKIIFPASLKKIGKYWHISLISDTKLKLVFKGKKAPALDKEAYLPSSKVYVPKGRKSNYVTAFKRLIDGGYITVRTY